MELGTLKRLLVYHLLDVLLTIFDRKSWWMPSTLNAFFLFNWKITSMTIFFFRKVSPTIMPSLAMVLFIFVTYISIFHRSIYLELFVDDSSSWWRYKHNMSFVSEKECREKWNALWYESSMRKLKENKMDYDLSIVSQWS